jgi:hypothetical protein
MSAWKILLQRLYQEGGSATRYVLDRGDFTLDKPLERLAEFGLVAPHGRHNGSVAKPWEITAKGVAFAEGRIRFALLGPRPARFVATWLSALPAPYRQSGKSSGDQLELFF